MKLNSLDMPSLESPFKREVINDVYVCTPKVTEGFAWVFENSVAVEKLDGTNVSVEIKNRKVITVRNRKNIIDDVWAKGNLRFTEGVVKSIDKNLFDPKKLEDGIYYGELLGEKVQGNPYKVDGHLWVPFDEVKKIGEYKFWKKFLEDLKGKNEAEIYEKVSTLFKGLWSLYKRKQGIKGEVSEESHFEETMAAEGIIFYSPEGRMAKLRRDMFDWYKGRRHPHEFEAKKGDKGAKNGL